MAILQMITDESRHADRATPKVRWLRLVVCEVCMGLPSLPGAGWLTLASGVTAQSTHFAYAPFRFGWP